MLLPLSLCGRSRHSLAAYCSSKLSLDAWNQFVFDGDFSYVCFDIKSLSFKGNKFSQTSGILHCGNDFVS